MADIVRPPRLDFHSGLSDEKGNSNLVFVCTSSALLVSNTIDTTALSYTSRIIKLHVRRNGYARRQPGPNKLVFEDDLDQGFKSLQPAVEFECPPSPTLEENEYFDHEADTDINMDMDVDPIDRDFYVDNDVREHPSQPDSPPLYFPPSDNKSLDNQSVLSLDLGTPAITHGEHYEWVSASEYIEEGDKQDDERVWDPEGDPKYLSNDAVLEDGPAREDQSELRHIVAPHKGQHSKGCRDALIIVTHRNVYTKGINQLQCGIVSSTIGLIENPICAEFETTFAPDFHVRQHMHSGNIDLYTAATNHFNAPSMCEGGIMCLHLGIKGRADVIIHYSDTKSFYLPNLYEEKTWQESCQQNRCCDLELGIWVWLKNDCGPREVDVAQSRIGHGFSRCRRERETLTAT
ncbi:hypothetical protein BD769DRAFT_1391694 [Suillus cothurnatus]|nr:hypothetical protein BD769DRAFT_1391694 [Suillus cothurnatus]